MHMKHQNQSDTLRFYLFKSLSQEDLCGRSTLLVTFLSVVVCRVVSDDVVVFSTWCMCWCVCFTAMRVISVRYEVQVVW